MMGTLEAGMDVGVVTRSFPELTNREVAELLASSGFRWTELCFAQTDSCSWVYNGRSDLSGLTDERAREIVRTYSDRGVEVASIGVFTNLLEPDDAELEANLTYFERHMEIAAACGVPYVATETGFVPGRRGVQVETYESAFGRLVDSFSRLALAAERHGVWVCLEACVLDPIPSAKRARDFIVQVRRRSGVDRLKALLDPANLIANSSEEDMFRYLAPHLGYFHAKDRRVNDARGRAVGDGDIDWPLFLRLYHHHAEGVPFILEYVTIDTFRRVRERVLEAELRSSPV
jgi:sugar phosphate isomerase/epimerase